MSKPKKKDYLLSLSIEQEIVDSLKEVAANHRRSMSAHIRWLIDQELRKNGKHPFQSTSDALTKGPEATELEGV